MSESTAVVSADYRVLDVESVDRQGSVAPLPFDFRPLPIPEGYTPKLEKLDAPTPKAFKRRHPKGFMYIPSEFPPKRLNEVFGPGGWTFRVMTVRPGRNGKEFFNGAGKKYIEVVVEGYILAPGIWPTYGIGSAMFSQDDFGDPRFMEATAQKAATSLALKDAAKKLGIGADVNEDSDTASALDGVKKTCVVYFDMLVGDTAKKAKTLTLVKKMSPLALTDEKLTAEMIDDDKADELMQELLKLV